MPKQPGRRAWRWSRKASTFGWERYASVIVGMKTFGASAPLKELVKKFGFTVEHVVESAQLAMKNA